MQNASPATNECSNLSFSLCGYNATREQTGSQELV
jgi:hypothetical protein